MTLTDTIEYINIALNYPALNYADLKLFFDMAIVELNTTLHTAIPTVAKMVEEYKEKMFPSIDNDIIFLENDPSTFEYAVPCVEEYSDDIAYDYFYCIADGKFYINTPNGPAAHDRLKGICMLEDGTTKMYEASYYGNNVCLWATCNIDNVHECIITDYLTEDWVVLWLVPYVCYKYTVRDGGTAQTFAEELTQGFQQLQDTYDVPYKVLLSNCAGLPAYAKLVKTCLPVLDVMVPTQAITPDMKHERNVQAVFSSMYDRGGF